MKPLDRFDISYEQLRERFEQVLNPRDAALIACIYAGCARVGEVVKGRYDKSPSILRSSVQFTPTHMILTLKTEKTKQWRRVPTSRKLEDWLHEPIRNYLLTLPDDKDELFPITTYWAEQIFKKWFGTGHIHLLRHWSCTHALQGKRTKKRLSIHEIQQLGGWTDLTAPSKIYSHYVVEDFIHRI